MPLTVTARWKSLGCDHATWIADDVYATFVNLLGSNGSLQNSSILRGDFDLDFGDTRCKAFAEVLLVDLLAKAIELMLNSIALVSMATLKGICWLMVWLVSLCMS